MDSYQALTTLTIKGLDCSSSILNELLDQIVSKQKSEAGFKYLIFEDFINKDGDLDEGVLDRLSKMCSNLEELVLDNSTFELDLEAQKRLINFVCKILSNRPPLAKFVIRGITNEPELGLEMI